MANKADKIVDYRFKVRRGKAQTWQSLNEVLMAGEFGLETDTRLMKMGDGQTPWNLLPYSITYPIDTNSSVEDGKVLAYNASLQKMQWQTSSGGGASFTQKTTTANQSSTTISFSLPAYLYAIACTKPCRIRLYAYQPDIATDSSRVVEEDAAPGISLLFEFLATSELLLANLTPAPFLYTTHIDNDRVFCSIEAQEATTITFYYYSLGENT